MDDFLFLHHYFEKVSIWFTFPDKLRSLVLPPAFLFSPFSLFPSIVQQMTVFCDGPWMVCFTENSRQRNLQAVTGGSWHWKIWFSALFFCWRSCLLRAPETDGHVCWVRCLFSCPFSHVRPWWLGLLLNTYAENNDMIFRWKFSRKKIMLREESVRSAYKICLLENPFSS